MRQLIAQLGNEKDKDLRAEGHEVCVPSEVSLLRAISLGHPAAPQSVVESKVSNHFNHVSSPFKKQKIG